MGPLITAEPRADRNEPAEQEMQKQVDFRSARAHYLLKMWKTNAAARTKREKTAEADLGICRRSPPRTYRAYSARLLATPSVNGTLVS